MIFSMRIRCAVLAVCLATTGQRLQALQTDEEGAAIRQSAARYVEAFNQRDAAAIAALWTPAAVYTNPRTGETFTGQAAIQAELERIFAEAKDAKLEVTVDSVEFLSPSVAIEQGSARVVSPTAEPDETTYSAVHIKTADGWRIDRMSEEPVEIAVSNYEHLKDLEWMIGSWADQDESGTIETTCRWTKNQNFINRSFAVTVGDQIEMSGIQLIGWDPAKQQIRSWVFDSDGGFGEATWKKKEDQWVVTSVATMPDGRRASAVTVMKVLDDHTFTWEATGRTVDGEILPNIDPITVVRHTTGE